MRLNGIFKDNLVFQRNRTIRIFGVAGEQEGTVSARIINGPEVISEGKTLSSGGPFVIELPGLPAGGPYKLEVIPDNGETAVINDIYIGEVWIAGGQSNMEYPLGRSDNASKTIRECPGTNIHFYQVPVAGILDEKAVKAEEQSRWNIISKDTCYNMSGVAFYFARDIEELLKDGNVHIGVIGCYLGGSSVSCWQSAEALGRTPEGSRYLNEYRDKCAVWSSKEEYLEAERKYQAETDEYAAKVDSVLKGDPYLTYLEAEKAVGGGPWPPPVTPVSLRRPGSLYEAMLMRIVPYAVKGVIFYQGEEDTSGHADDYAVVFRSMIDEWRALFRDEKMPFLFCELPWFKLTKPGGEAEEEPGWPVVRQQQKLVADTVPFVYLADIKDCGENDNVHPSDKATPAERLAMLARRFIY